MSPDKFLPHATSFEGNREGPQRPDLARANSLAELFDVRILEAFFREAIQKGSKQVRLSEERIYLVCSDETSLSCFYVGKSPSWGKCIVIRIDEKEAV